jgi:hypothetical protein
MADNQIIPVNMTKGQPMFPPVAQTPTPQGPPVPPEVLAAMHEPLAPIDNLVNSETASSAQAPQLDDTPPAPTNVPGLDAPQLTGVNVPQGTPTLPPEISDLVQSEAATGNGIPKRHKGVLEHIGDILPIVGMIGAGMEAAGDPAHPPVGAQMFQQSLEAARDRQLKAQNLQQVEIPKARAYADYLSGKNATAVDVQGLKNVGGANIADIKNAGNWDVATLKAQVALGKVTRVEDGVDPETGQLGKFAYNAANQLVGVVKNALPSANYLPKTTNRQQLSNDAEGNIVKVPITSTVAPSLPGRAVLPPQVPSSGGGVPSNQNPVRPKVSSQSGQGNTAIPVMGPGGTPLHKQMSVDARKTISQIYSAQNMIDDISPDLQSVVNEAKRGGNLADTAKVRSAWFQYRSLGLDPSNIDPSSVASLLPNIDPRLARIFPTIAMLQIVGSQPYMRGMRNFNYIKQIQAHIPDPEKDTPDLMLSKMQQMQHNLPGLESAIRASEGLGERTPVNAPPLPGKSPITNNSGMISVQIPGHPPGQIPAGSKKQFLLDNPGAKVLP